MAARLSWNPWVRRGIAHEKLCVWVFRFVERLARDTIAYRIEETLRDAGVHAFTVSEVLGSYDHLVQIWVPDELSPLALDEALYITLRDLDAYMETDYFEVDTVLRDSRWGPSTSSTPLSQSLAYAPSQPDIRLLSPEGLTAEERANIEILNTVDWSSYRRATQTLTADEEAALEWATSNRLAVLETFAQTELHLIFVIAPPIAVLAVGQHKFDYTVRQNVRAAILDLEIGPGVRMRFYEGKGMALYIGLVTMPAARFYLELDEILTKLNTSVASQAAKVFTIVGAGSLPLTECTHLTTPRELGSVDAPAQEVKRLLSELEIGSGEESDALEFKGSIKLDINRMLHADESGGIAVAEATKVLDSFVHAVCAMLNRAEGGRIVVGIVEASKLFERSRVSDPAKQAEVLEQSGFERVAGSRDLWLSPLAQDAVLLGAPKGIEDWDKYRNQIQRLVFDNIKPAPAGLVTINDKDLGGGFWTIELVVTGRGRDERGPWYYARGRDFCVRDGASTRVLFGADGDVYKGRVVSQDGPTVDEDGAGG